ncbi:fumarylacetoacetate hydrolase family protein [Magnetospirillum sp. UT-4]|uniref:fumarylacetoacetate hydrolase family protein n=1 Tax=Magnetospirillum sp. UT-4 TaxID=2681467 RepID=UPI001381E0E4|nr:fumarylacetoacetate hydrolase family protein [Magnetospirillum sp. UT-4]CAA7623944.1 Fumarylpyruvate hydrolase [Magnetospirillum sp. UT-4]
MSPTLFQISHPVVPVLGETAAYPVRRIFCVGRNYAAHAREMGSDPTREAPCYFTKSADSVVPGGGPVPYPPGTANLHHEVELVVALGAPVFRANAATAAGAVFGHAVGLDLTRRDLQLAAKDLGQPWDLGKSFEFSAPVSPLRRAAAPVLAARIELAVNGTVRQSADVADMTWSVPEVIAHLSRFYHLGPGDLIFTGTPEGVGPVVPGDRIEARIDGIGELAVDITVG